MKKLLAILGSASIIATSGISAVACETTVDDKDDRIKEGALDDVCKITNIIANRHYSTSEQVSAGVAAGLKPNPKLLGNENVTELDVIAGINQMNGTAIKESDVTIEFKDKDKKLATVTANEGSKFTGEANFQVNKDAKFEDLIKNKDLGTIFIPESMPFPPEPNSSGVVKKLVPQLTILMEFIGDRNRELEYITDAISLLSFKETIGNTKQVIEETRAVVTLPKNQIITGGVEFSYKTKTDNRPGIKELVKVTDLGELANDDSETIIKAVYAKNKTTLKSYKEEEILDAINVTIEAKKSFIEFKAGNNKFLGHDPASFSVINGALEEGEKFKREDYQLDITYTVKK
ncbi:hypothetical protein SSABA_v1c04580 [Spiroplasma sabaudiense Ar-1343]|uniref:Lipoprotein n=1 Tax=Spiroplasma sabaudiense Ar-1343 TaxID=1276257 RepID=W6AAJ0_9MOLU|nr:lipoprotein [Spiroplasma sabaudiense]AHI53865.1 hypothetical protein SSABA_v1c04580 [Spiroplasma sabaudiense Ar-1343]